MFACSVCRFPQTQYSTKIQIYKMRIISIPKIYSEKLRKDIIRQIKAEGKLVDSQNVSS